MKSWVLISISLVLGSAHCQPSIILIEACNEVKNADKRLECLKAALPHADSLSKKTPSADIDAVAKAFTKMESNLGVGLSYNAYKIALLELAATVAEYKRVNGDLSNNKGFISVEKSIDTYKDAATFWDYSIWFNSKPGNNKLYHGAIPATDDVASQLIGKYKIPTAAGDFLGLTRVLKRAETLSSMWAVANKYSSMGFEEIRDPGASEAKVSSDESVIFLKREQSWGRPIASEIMRKVSTPSVGVEFHVLPGSRVKAAAAGKVVYSSNKLNGYGNLIIIKHDDVYLTAYFYNKRNLVREGESVQQGQEIAEGGEILGYEVREKGVAVDPESFLPAL